MRLYNYIYIYIYNFFSSLSLSSLLHRINRQCEAWGRGDIPEIIFFFHTPVTGRGGGSSCSYIVWSLVQSLFNTSLALFSLPFPLDVWRDSLCVDICQNEVDGVLKPQSPSLFTSCRKIGRLGLYIILYEYGSPFSCQLGKTSTSKKIKLYKNYKFIFVIAIRSKDVMCIGPETFKIVSSCQRTFFQL